MANDADGGGPNDDTPVRSRPSRKPDWDAIERTYLGSDLTVAQICAVFGISQSQFYRKRREENWPLRSEMKRRGAQQGESEDAGSDAATPSEVPPAVCPVVPTTASGQRVWRKGMITRLYAAMERQLAEIERQQRAEIRMTGAERERHTRQMNVMTRSMEKLAEFDEQETRRLNERRKAAGRKKTTGSRDPEAWRLEIAQRITRIRERWLAEEAARDA